jgi:hypothetical protein
MTGKTTPLYVVCSPCRCVGKTLISRLLAERCVIDGRPVAAFDLADEGPQLADYLPDFTTIADIDDTTGQMAFFERLIADEDTARVVDLSHRTFKNFFTVAQKIGFFEEARRRAIEPLILFINDPDPKSGKAYAVLRHWFAQASLLPVHNQIAAPAIPYRDASANASGVPASLEIPVLGFSLRALVDRQSFSFSEFWRTTPAGLPDALDDELRDWVEHVFLQVRNLELSLRCEEPSTRVAARGLIAPRTTRRQRQRNARPLGGNSQRDVELAAMTQRAFDTPKEVLDYAPKQKPRIDGDRMDQSGNAIVAMLQEAADLSNGDCDRARTMADELSHQLRAAEDRINQLETEIEHVQDRAVRAETWLQLIQKEVEKLMVPTATTRPKSTM